MDELNTFRWLLLLLDLMISVLAWVPGNFKGEKYIAKSAVSGHGCFNRKLTPACIALNMPCFQQQRTMYYVIDTTAREEETQKKGFVVVFWFAGRKGITASLGLIRKLHSIRLAMPHKMLGLHFCFDDSTLKPFMSGLRFLLDENGRKRFRAHYGDEQRIEFRPREGLLAISLSNLNPQNHLGIALGNISRMEKGETWYQVRYTRVRQFIVTQSLTFLMYSLRT